MENETYYAFIFYGSYYHRLQAFDRDTRLRLYEAIIQFSCAGIEPDFDKDTEIYRVWLWIRNTIDVNNDMDRYDRIPFEQEIGTQV